MTYHPKHDTEFFNPDGTTFTGTALYQVSIDGNGNYYGDRELQCDYANLHGVLIGNHLIEADHVAAMFGADVVAIFASEICDELNEQLARGETPETINFRPTIALAAE